MTILADSVRWLAGQQETQAGKPIVYRQGGLSVELVAVVIDQEYSTFDEVGIPLRVSSRDYSIKQADLVAGGKPIEPRRGDTIIETVNGEYVEHEVMPLGGEGVYQDADTDGQIILIHTKRIQ